jgi:hypothetical protein
MNFTKNILSFYMRSKINVHNKKLNLLRKYEQNLLDDKIKFKEVELFKTVELSDIVSQKLNNIKSMHNIENYKKIRLLELTTKHELYEISQRKLKELISGRELTIQIADGFNQCTDNNLYQLDISRKDIRDTLYEIKQLKEYVDGCNNSIELYLSDLAKIERTSHRLNQEYKDACDNVKSTEKRLSVCENKIYIESIELEKTLELYKIIQ